MKPDIGTSGVADQVSRAHLKDPADRSHTMHRYGPGPDLVGLVRGFWVPVWSVPPGRAAPQRVLQHPVCLLVVTPGYGRFYGVVPGLSTTTLTGDGWAVGVLCEPAAGHLLARGPMSDHTDRVTDLDALLGADGTRLVRRVREAMAADPLSADAHRTAMAAYADALRSFTPVDTEGLLVNDLVRFVEEHTDVTRVTQVCERFGMSERSLQRLVQRRLGLTPKWLIQRRRLHEAAARLRERSTTLRDVAADLGYADQAHFIRDFAGVTGMTPGAFATAQQAVRPG